MEKVIITDEDLAAEMGCCLSDNLYYEDSFTIPAFVRFCKNLPPFLRVQYYTDDFPEREKQIAQSVCIHFYEHAPIIIDLSSDWFLTVFLRDRGFVREFTSSYQLFKYKPLNSINNET